VNSKLNGVVTIVLIMCALLTTGLVLRREFMVPSVGPAREQKPAYIEDWRNDRLKGVLVGPESAPVQLIEFADFECPYCGDFHKKLNAVQAGHPNQIGVTFVHFPIPGHRFAISAARVAECATDQGRFEAMYDQLFDGQEQFGLKPWVEYATAAGVPDIAAFETCINKTNRMPRVEEGKALGAKLDVQGTPTIIINGWRLGHPPTAEELDLMVRRVLAGKSPVDGKS
jgi:protein-disulfide isomerase